MQFSKSWMERFKEKNNLRFQRVHGEAASVDTEAIEVHMPHIQRIVLTFQACDMWNADEFSLFYRQAPS